MFAGFSATAYTMLWTKIIQMLSGLEKLPLRSFKKESTDEERTSRSPKRW
jgi:hypothetical protein